MRPPDRNRATQLIANLRKFDKDTRLLPGIRPDNSAETFVEQLVESLRRIEFVHRIRDAKHDPRRADPTSALFDPLKGSVLKFKQGQFDESFWLVFIATHFGKHSVDGWRLTRDVYGRLGGPGLWDWAAISNKAKDFRAWLSKNEATLRGSDGIRRRFSNHRKYESLKADSKNGTAAIFESYVAWITQFGDHRTMIQEAHKLVGQNPYETFDYLYRSMAAVDRFGRLGKFDYLTMLGKLGFAPIEPGSAYLWDGATGPYDGARLMFGGATNAELKRASADALTRSLGDALNVGMQAMEDALCNWQKSPRKMISFRG